MEKYCIRNCRKRTQKQLNNLKISIYEKTFDNTFNNNNFKLFI